VSYREFYLHACNPGAWKVEAGRWPAALVLMNFLERWIQLRETLITTLMALWYTARPLPP